MELLLGVSEGVEGVLWSGDLEEGEMGEKENPGKVCFNS